MIIGIDFDGVLFPTLDCVLDAYNKQHENKVTLEQITTYNLYECLDSSVADDILALFNNKDIYNNLKPFRGAAKAIDKFVTNGHQVYVVTAADTQSVLWKEQLIERYFPCIPKNNIIKIHQKSLLNLDVLIEDSIDNLISCFCERICLDAPYNHNEHKDYVYDIHRASNWGEISNIVNKLAKEMNKWEE